MAKAPYWLNWMYISNLAPGGRPSTGNERIQKPRAGRPWAFLLRQVEQQRLAILNADQLQGRLVFDSRPVAGGEPLAVERHRPGRYLHPRGPAWGKRVRH